jgi:hypothetical protein
MISFMVSDGRVERIMRTLLSMMAEGLACCAAADGCAADACAAADGWRVLYMRDNMYIIFRYFLFAALAVIFD